MEENVMHICGIKYDKDQKGIFFDISIARCFVEVVMNSVD